jgi:hypothetical protein
MPRLYRRLEELLDLIYLAERSDLKRIATTEGLGYDLATGEGIHAAVSAVNNAVLEARKASDRQKRKKRAQAKAGKFNGGSRPYGYEADGVTLRPSEAAIIREVTRRILDGESARSIVADLRRRGVKTAADKDWHIITISQLFRSLRICGIRTHHGVEYPAEWPAIISREEWEQVRLILQARAGVRQVRPRRYLLTGVVVCGNCGVYMSGANWHDPRNGKTAGRYRCSADQYNHHPRGCGKVSRRTEPIDMLVSEAVLYRLDSPQFARVLSAQAHDGELQVLLNQYQTQKTKLDDLVTDYASGLLDRQQLALAKSVVEDALEATRRRLATIQSGRVLARIPLDGNLRQVWEAADIDFRRDLIRLMVEKVVVKPGRKQPLWRGRYRFDPSLIEIVWKA